MYKADHADCVIGFCTLKGRVVHNTGKQRDAIAVGDHEQEGSVQNKIDDLIRRGRGTGTGQLHIAGGGDTLFVDCYPGSLVYTG